MEINFTHVNFGIALLTTVYVGFLFYTQRKTKQSLKLIERILVEKVKNNAQELETLLEKYCNNFEAMMFSILLQDKNVTDLLEEYNISTHKFIITITPLLKRMKEMFINELSSRIEKSQSITNEYVKKELNNEKVSK